MRKVLSPNLGGKYSRIGHLDRDELGFGYIDDPEIDEYLTEKDGIHYVHDVMIISM